MTTKSSSVSFSADSPLSVQAAFSLDYLNLSIIAVIAIAALAIGSFAVMRRTRGSPGPAAPEVSVRAAPTVTPALPKTPGPQTQEVCPTCHNPIVKGEPFCPSCGAKLGPGLSFCRQCGHPVSPNALFCNQCGSKLT